MREHRRITHHQKHREQFLLLTLLIVLLVVALLVSHLPFSGFISWQSGGQATSFGGPGGSSGALVPYLPSGPVTQKTLLLYGFSSHFTPTGALTEISNAYARLRFLTPVDVSGLTVDHFNDVDLLFNYAFIDTSSDDFVFFQQVPAEITLFSVPWFPGLSSFLRYSNTGQPQPCVDCVFVGYDRNGVTFRVSGFSGYGVNNPSPPFQLDVLLTAATSYATTADDLMCQPVGTTDPDGDTVITNYQFIDNDVNYTMVATSFDVNTSLVAPGGVYDFSGNGYHATLGNGIVANAPQWVGLEGGKVGGAYHFDGVNDVIVFQPRILNWTNAGVTFEAWVNLSTNTDYSVIVADGAVQGYSLGVHDGNGRLFFAVSNASLVYKVSYPTSILQQNIYYHLVGVHDGNLHRLFLYVNGILLNSSVGPGAISGSSSGSEKLSVGTDLVRDVLDLQVPSYFNGTIDQVMVFNRSLSAEEILQHAQLHYNILDDAETSVGDVWSCVATPTDGYYLGASNQSNTLTIVDNQPPTHNPPLLAMNSNANTTLDDAQCFAQGVSDLEGYSTQTYTTFIVNGTTTTLYLPFERSPYSHLEDYSGYGNNGTVFEAQFTTSGILTGAYQFDGVDDYVMVKDHSTLNFDNSTNFTADVWVKPGLSIPGDTTIFAKGDAITQPGYSLVLSGQGTQVIFRMKDPEGVFQLATPLNTLVPNAYSYIAIVADRGGTANLYVNGQLRASQPLVDANNNLIGNITNTLPLLIANNTVPSTGFFNGIIDELRFTPTFFTPAQLQNHYLLLYDRLDDTMSKKGQQLSCAVTPHDGYASGQRKISNSVTILNSPPTHHTPTLSTPTGANLDNENLTCLYQNTQDVDGDQIRQLYTFVLDDLPLNVIYLPLEMHPAASTQVLDHSLYGNNGTVFGASFVQNGGAISGAYHFDGIDNYLTILDHDTLDLLYDITVEFWVKFTSFADQMPLLMKSADVVGVNQTNYGVRTGGSLTGTNSRDIEFVFDTNGAMNTYTTGGSNLQAGQWYHVVVVKTYTAMPQIYINSAFQNASCTRGTCTQALEDNNGPLTVGRGVVGNLYHYFNGVLDEVRVYDFPLTPAQIFEHSQQHYHRIIGDMTLVGDQWYCMVTPHDGEMYGTTKFSNTLDILDPAGGGAGGGNGESLEYIFHWYPSQEPSVTFTMQTLWELRIHDINESVPYYEVTISSVDHYNGRTILHIYPTVGPLIMYEGDVVPVDLDADGNDDITIAAHDFSYETATYTFSLTADQQSAFTPPVTAPPPPSTFAPTSNTSGTLPGYHPLAPLFEQPTVVVHDYSSFTELFTTVNIPYRGLVVALLIILILITFFTLMRRVKTG